MSTHDAVLVAARASLAAMRDQYVTMHGVQSVLHRVDPTHDRRDFWGDLDRSVPITDVQVLVVIAHDVYQDMLDTFVAAQDNTVATTNNETGSKDEEFTVLGRYSDLFRKGDLLSIPNTSEPNQFPVTVSGSFMKFVIVDVLTNSHVYPTSKSIKLRFFY